MDLNGQDDQSPGHRAMSQQPESIFGRCDFLINKTDDSVVIVLPTQLPRYDALNIVLDGDQLIFRSGDDDFAHVPLINTGIIEKLSAHQQVGLIETENGIPTFPAYITAVAQINIGLDESENMNKNNEMGRGTYSFRRQNASKPQSKLRLLSQSTEHKGDVK